MAEAVVEERPAVQPRYYCHMCNVEINIPNTDYTCPLCAGGFVEELPSGPSTPSINASTSSSTSSMPEGTRSSNEGFNGFNNLNALRGEIATFLLSRNGPNVEISIDPGNRRSNFMTLGGGGSGGGAGGVGGSGSGASAGGSHATIHTGGGRVRPQAMDRLDHVLLDFLQSLSGGEEAPQMFFMGNPGDYAWGREGIDTIVTQLLNQMETSGPPPLAKDKIAEIPKVEITAEEVDKKLQCSVCWEDFRLEETVRKLPCAHLYHEQCIVPWLDLHGTCPICRKSLTDDENGSTDVEMTSENHTLPGECPVHRNQRDGNSSGSGGGGSVAPNTSNRGSTTSQGTQRQQQQHQQQQQPQRNMIFDFDDFDVDLD